MPDDRVQELNRRSKAGKKAAAASKRQRTRTRGPRGETPFAALERINSELDAEEGAPVRGSARGDFTPAEIFARVKGSLQRIAGHPDAPERPDDWFGDAPFPRGVRSVG